MVTIAICVKEIDNGNPESSLLTQESQTRKKERPRHQIVVLSLRNTRNISKHGENGSFLYAVEPPIAITCPQLPVTKKPNWPKSPGQTESQVDASQLKSWVFLQLRLARPCVYLR